MAAATLESDSRYSFAVSFPLELNRNNADMSVAQESFPFQHQVNEKPTITPAAQKVIW